MKVEIEQKKEIDRTIRKDDIVSVPFGNKFLIGSVIDINPEKIKINTYSNSEIEITNNDKVYKFFPGQKFDFREFNKADVSTPEGLSISARLDKFLSKTTIGSFSEFIKNNKSDLVQLLKGRMTNNMFNGNSIVLNENGDKQLQSWACKFQLYRGKDGNLKMNTAWKQDVLQKKVYGIELTPEQITKTVEKNQSIVIERISKEEIPFKVFCKYDKDLNAFVTSQYSEKVEELMKNSYSKREIQEITNSRKPEKNIKTVEKINKPKEKKGRSL